jgi:hypothetical protein
MSQSVKLAVWLVVTLCVGLTFTCPAFAQSMPSAYVYVITNPSANNYEIDGYKADSTGALTSLAGSPFWKTTKTLLAMAHTTNWFFVSDGTNIYSFSIAASGALKQVSSVDAAKYYPFDGLAGGSLVLDHTGSTLYSLADDGTGDNEFQFFNKNSSTGSLSFFGSTPVDISYGQLVFTGNNQFAFGFGCFQDESHVYGFSRGVDGTLTSFSPAVQFPTDPNGNFCLDTGAPNPANNLAVSMYLETATQPPGPPAWLGVYTVEGSGNLTTKSTSANMPTAAVGTVHQMVASPAGNLLAIGGSSGLQIFHFNDSNPITPYTSLLATHELNQILWDSHDHLYGISRSGRLYAFKITSTGHKQASGSPYSITNPMAITVLSK